MRIFLSSVFAIGLLACTLTSRSQSADDIINKSNNAVGGEAVLSKIKSVYIEGNVSVMGNDLPYKITMLTGKGMKTETVFNGTNIIQCLTDTSGWMLNPMQGQANAMPLPKEAVEMGKSSLDIRGELYHFKEKGYTDSLAGRENFDSVNTYKIKLSKPGITLVYYIDPTTYYVRKLETSVTVDGKEVSNTSTYSDYRKTDMGYIAAYGMGVNNMGYDLKITFTKFVVNAPVDASAFAMPH